MPSLSNQGRYYSYRLDMRALRVRPAIIHFYSFRSIALPSSQPCVPRYLRVSSSDRIPIMRVMADIGKTIGSTKRSVLAPLTHCTRKLALAIDPSPKHKRLYIGYTLLSRIVSQARRAGR
jgi:hypothetical protein